jgi:putative transposase
MGWQPLFGPAMLVIGFRPRSSVMLCAVFPLPARSSHGGGAVAARIVSHDTVRQWARKFGQHFANHIRRRLPRAADKWHLDEVVLKISGVKHWLW